jgi:Flp pilus assembly protein TadB
METKMADVNKEQRTQFAPLDEQERLPREMLIRQPWYMRTQGKPIYMGFAWLVAFILVLEIAWGFSHNIAVVVVAIVLLLGAFWWLTRTKQTKVE